MIVVGAPCRNHAAGIFVHTQRDRNIKIERNDIQRVNRNQIHRVGPEMSSEVVNTLRQMEGGDLHIGIGPRKRGTITPSGATEDTQGLGLLAEGMGDVGSNLGAGNFLLSVEVTKNQSIEAHHFERVREDKSTEVGGHYMLDVGRSIEITAGDSITIKVGRSLLTMQDNGEITLNGKRLAVTMDKLFEALSDLIKLN